MKCKMTLIPILLLFLLSFFSGCSFFNKEKSENDAFADSEDIFFDSSDKEMSEDANEEINDVLGYNSEGREDKIVLGGNKETEKSFFEDEEVPKVIKQVKNPPIKIKEEVDVDREVAGIDSYKVKKNETLMWIAFKMYGDYRKWKTLSRANGNIVDVKEGMILKCPNTGKKFNWRPKGLPYLIKGGDTLSKISKNVYGVHSKWKLIYENNRQMIRNPNLIFKGFTLYYLNLKNQLAAH